jgi:mono/diheme cytochrome c family protein
MSPGDESKVVPPDKAAAPADGKKVDLATEGEKIYQSHGCVNCHGEGGVGTPQASSLIDIGKQLSANQLKRLLQNPTDTMNAGGMPPVALNDSEWASLLTYLGSLKASGSETRGNPAVPALNRP